MLTDDNLNALLADGDISQSKLEPLFETLDKVGVGALWVDKNFEHYHFNNSQTLMKRALDETGNEFIPYHALVDIIRKRLNNTDHVSEDSDNMAKNWLAKMREHQKMPLTPTDEHLFLTGLGNHYISRRVFLNDGSMLVISFDYASINSSKELKTLAFNRAKAGAVCYNLVNNKFHIESPYLERILTPRDMKRVRRQGLFAIMHPEDLAVSKDIFKRSLQSTEEISRNIRVVIGADDIRWLKYTGQMTKDENGTPHQHLSFFEDITEELKIQDNLRQNIQQSNAELKERLDFMAKLSHELKTPMNAIVGLSDVLVNSSDASPEMKSKLEIILASSETLVAMLDETLSHAKLKNDNTSLNYKPHDPAKVIGDICKLWEHQALKKGTKINFSIDPNVPNHIMMDGLRIGQCLNNLISNAVKFTEYGKIDIMLKLHAPKNKAQQLALIVRDDGIGMTEEQLGRIFEAYKQADETIASRFGGTGLGMSITKDLIELMDGNISVKSIPNKGTLFLILLPIKIAETSAMSDIFQTKPQESAQKLAPLEQTTNVAPEASKADQPAADAAKSQTPSQRLMAKMDVTTSDLENLNVLVVDDNETNHIVMNSLLESVVAKVYSAYNGKEALDTLKVEHIDIVLMDIHMPIMDGIEATIAIRSNPDIYPDVHIIALTADPQFQQKRLCVNIGMDEAMAKPVKLVDLIETIKKTVSAPINKLAKAS